MFIGALAFVIVFIIIGIVIGFWWCIWQVLKWLYKLVVPITPEYINKTTGKPTSQLGILYQSAKEKFCAKIKWTN